MNISVKDIIRRRKSVRTFSEDTLRTEDPRFETDDSIEYIVTYEVKH